MTAQRQCQSAPPLPRERIADERIDRWLLTKKRA
jgi:hypothetical protein